jgi:2-deoxy-D-gluconate 3-dehydrogenase
LHQAGARVLIADLNQEKADALAADLNAQRPDSAASFALDVSKADEVESAFGHAVETFGQVDILVNNAGVYPMIPLANMSEDDFMKVINVNLRSVFLTTKAASEHMKAKGIKGKIINVTSIDAIHPSMVGLAHYDASKHGEWGFTKNTALELAAFGITVNAIAPGAIATPGTGVVDGVVPDALKPFIERVPMGRMGTGDDIAKVALFLASDLSSYMTGSQVVVDGGILLR